jgi:hypothetical protein
LKELVENERANFKVIKEKDRLPKRLQEYKKELDSLVDEVSCARSV